MAELTDRRATVTAKVRHEIQVSDRGFQAFRILHVAFIAAPTIAGLDKYFQVLVDWDKYLAPAIANLLPVSAHTFMLVVGVIEVTAGLIVALKPRLGAYIIAAWMAGTILNLLVHGSYYDIALRDFGLMLGALALGRLSETYEHRRELPAKTA